MSRLLLITEEESDLRLLLRKAFDEVTVVSARAREVYGVPHDAGWAPCCIETGWTVGEILMGLQFMERVEAIRAAKG